MGGSTTFENLPRFFKGEEVELIESPLEFSDELKEGEPIARSKVISATQDLIEKCLGGKEKVNGKKLLYIQDVGLVKPKTPEREVATVISIVEKIREQVHKVLSDHGADVLRLRQGASAATASENAYRENGYPVGWGQVLSAEGAAIKISLRRGSIPRETPFTHPNVVADRLFRAVLHGNPVSCVVAPDYTGVPTLAELYGKLSRREKIEYLIQGMRGNAYMHDEGWIHGDIKPDNLLVVKDDGGQYRAMLSDLEVAMRKGRDANSIGFTPLYSEEFHYNQGNPMGFHQHPIDCKKDVFSWGVTTLETFDDVPREKRVAVLHGNNERFFRYIDFVLYRQEDAALKDVIKSMVQQNRDKRPELCEIIPKLQAMM